jgi:hypothetical protein
LLIDFYEGVAGNNGHSNNVKVLPANPWSAIKHP